MSTLMTRSEFNKKATIIATAIFFVFSIFIIAIPQGRAEEGDPDPYLNGEYGWRGAQDERDDTFHTEWASTILSGVGPVLLSSVQGTVSISLLGVQMGSNLETVAVDYAKNATHPVIFDSAPQIGVAYKLMFSIAAIWVLAVALSHLFSMLEKGQDPVEAVFKCLVEITLAGILMLNFNKIMALATGIPLFIVAQLQGTDPEFAATVVNPDMCCQLITQLTGKDAGHHTGMMYTISCAINMIIPYFIEKLLLIVAEFHVYSILFEIALRRLFSPLAAADIYQEGLRSPGFRYVKKYMACVLRLGVLLVIGIFAGKVTNLLTLNTATVDSVAGVANNGSKLNKAFALIVVNLSAVGMMGKSSEVVNDSLGV